MSAFRLLPGRDRGSAARFWLITGLFAVFILLVRQMPAIDWTAAALFYDADRGGFPAVANPFLEGLRDVNEIIIYVCLLGLLGRLILPRQYKFGDAKALLFVLVVLICGTGITINSLFKETIGRPRPHQVEMFGGAHPYVPPAQDAAFCQSNCSFPSGEAGLAFTYAAIALTLSGKPAMIALGLGLVWGVAMSGMRMSFGAHWLSDVITSGFVVFVWAWVFGWLFYTRSPPWLSSEAIDKALFATRSALGRELGYALRVHADAISAALNYLRRIFGPLVERIRTRL
ncbi:MAG: phosphatase PAP2 family protein [Pseudomonadota bacterium]